MSVLDLFSVDDSGWVGWYGRNSIFQYGIRKSLILFFELLRNEDRLRLREGREFDQWSGWEGMINESSLRFERIEIIFEIWGFRCDGSRPSYLQLTPVFRDLFKYVDIIIVTLLISKY